MNLDREIIDTLIEKPYGFEIKKRKFSVYPTTLGVMLYTQTLKENLNINIKAFERNPIKEAVRIVKNKKEDCCHIIAAYTCRTKDEINSLAVHERKEFFVKNMEDDDIIALLMAILSNDNTAELMKKLGIDKEQDRLSKVMKVKSSKNTITFNAKSIYGTVIAPLVEYGWTLDYILWGISYTNLRLILADKMVSVYLTDEELKSVPKSILPDDGIVIKADDPSNKEAIRNMSWK